MAGRVPTLVGGGGVPTLAGGGVPTLARVPPPPPHRVWTDPKHNLPFCTTYAVGNKHFSRVIFQDGTKVSYLEKPLFVAAVDRWTKTKPVSPYISFLSVTSSDVSWIKGNSNITKAALKC